jgi:5-formyltetrahydrofolate cyclo-ligase
MSDISARKARIREAMLAQRGRLSPQAQGIAAEKVLGLLQENLHWSQLRRIALYRAIGGEVATSEMESWLRSQGKALFFPRTHRDWTLEMVAMGSADPWVRSFLGTEEPAPGKSAARAADLDLVILPGVAFDRQGRRLGRGKGCYDRWLENFSGIRVGLAHPFQLLEEIPEESFDEGVDFIVTPEEFLQVKRKV